MPSSMPLGNVLAMTFVVVHASSSPSRFKEQVALINAQISAVPASTNILSLMYDVRSGGEFSHLFKLYASNDHLVENRSIRRVSGWSLKKLSEHYEERDTDVRRLFNLVRTEPPITSINEVIWERQCRRFFRSL